MGQIERWPSSNFWARIDASVGGRSYNRQGYRISAFLQYLTTNFSFICGSRHLASRPWWDNRNKRIWFTHFSTWNIGLDTFSEGLDCRFDNRWVRAGRPRIGKSPKGAVSRFSLKGNESFEYIQKSIRPKDIHKLRNYYLLVICDPQFPNDYYFLRCVPLSLQCIKKIPPPPC